MQKRTGMVQKQGIGLNMWSRHSHGTVHQFDWYIVDAQCVIYDKYTVLRHLPENPERSENDLGDTNLAQSTIGVSTMHSQIIP